MSTKEDHKLKGHRENREQIDDREEVDKKSYDSFFHPTLVPGSRHVDLQPLSFIFDFFLDSFESQTNSLLDVTIPFPLFAGSVFANISTALYSRVRDRELMERGKKMKVIKRMPSIVLKKPNTIQLLCFLLYNILHETKIRMRLIRVNGDPTCGFLWQ